MMTPLLPLTLASLLLPTAFSSDYERTPDEYWRFCYHHTLLYRIGHLDCNREMEYKQIHGRNCLTNAIIILGDDTDAASPGAIINICRGEGTSVGKNMFKSNKSFRLAKCTLQKNSSTGPSNCSYKPKYMTEQITVGCKQGFPVLLDGITYDY